ncbi:hypothetical protein ACIHCV_46105 [Streptomyces sp. NPDC051956]|uniref:hypothetical protein n=1 Tax=Streptomyces sp. NPDC051956 TaxID=3365677 RepID=UPI0037D28D4A
MLTSVIFSHRLPVSSGIGQATLPDKIRTVQNVCARLKRAWQVHNQPDYFLLYGSFETDQDPGAFYQGCGYTDPGDRPASGHLEEHCEAGTGQ